MNSDDTSLINVENVKTEVDTLMCPDVGKVSSKIPSINVNNAEYPNLNITPQPCEFEFLGSSEIEAVSINTIDESMPENICATDQPVVSLPTDIDKSIRCCEHFCRPGSPPPDRKSCCYHRCRPTWTLEQRKQIWGSY